MKKHILGGLLTPSIFGETCREAHSMRRCQVWIRPFFVNGSGNRPQRKGVVYESRNEFDGVTYGGEGD